MEASNNPEESQSQDEELDTEQTVRKKVVEFTRVFTKAFKANLDAYCNESFLNSKGKPGKIADLLNRFGNSIGATASILLFGLPTTAAGVVTGSTIGGLLQEITKNDHRGKAEKITRLFSERLKDHKLEDDLINIGIEIFEKFEYQFRIATSDNGWEIAINKLAIDAVDRIMNHFDKNYASLIEDPKMMNDNFKNSALSALLLGESKGGLFANIMSRNSGKYRLILKKLTKTGHKIKVNAEEWQTSEIYEKPGIVLLDRFSGDPVFYYNFPDNNDKKKYGFRLAFQFETKEISKHQEKVIKELSELDRNHIYNYILIKKRKNTEYDENLKKETSKRLETELKKESNRIVEKIEQEGQQTREKLSEKMDYVVNVVNYAAQDIKNEVQKDQEVVKKIEDIKKIDTENTRLALGILFALAYFKPNEIVYSNIFLYLNRNTNKEDLESALDLLKSHSLIREKDIVEESIQESMKEDPDNIIVIGENAIDGIKLYLQQNNSQREQLKRALSLFKKVVEKKSKLFNENAYHIMSALDYIVEYPKLIEEFYDLTIKCFQVLLKQPEYKNTISYGITYLDLLKNRLMDPDIYDEKTLELINALITGIIETEELDSELTLTHHIIGILDDKLVKFPLYDYLTVVTDLATILNRAKKYKEAEDLCKNALNSERITEEEKEVGTADGFGLVKLKFELGIALFCQKKYQESLQVLDSFTSEAQSALNYRNDDGNLYERRVVIRLLSYIESQLGNHARSIEYAQKALLYGEKNFNNNNPQDYIDFLKDIKALLNATLESKMNHLALRVSEIFDDFFDYTSSLIDNLLKTEFYTPETLLRFIDNLSEQLIGPNIERESKINSLRNLAFGKITNPCQNKRARLSLKKRSLECLLSWEDVDEFNLEQTRENIIIDSDKFINYLETIQSWERRDQLIQLADSKPVVGKFKDSVSSLVESHKIINHLNRVAKVSSVTMHGMILKDTIADLLHGDYGGVAINLGFIAGNSLVAKISEVASTKGARLISNGKLLLGGSLKLASPFLARATSAFVVYDLVNQAKAYESGDKDALVEVVGDSIYIGVDVAEVGIEVAEAFSILEGVSSITGPIGATIGTIVFVGTAIYRAANTVNRIDSVVHLTDNERFIEGFRAFLGIDSSFKEIIEKKQTYDKLVKAGIDFLIKNTNIIKYIFPTWSNGTFCAMNFIEVNMSCTIGSVCDRRISPQMDCKTEFHQDLNNKIFLDAKRSDIKLTRAIPDKQQNMEFLCLPIGDHAPPPGGEGYLCENAIGIEYQINRTGNYAMIDLGDGDDNAIGDDNSTNIFIIGNGSKEIVGGQKDNIFILRGKTTTGSIIGSTGYNTLDVSDFGLASELFLRFDYKLADLLIDIDSSAIELTGIDRVIGRKNKKDHIICDCDLSYVDGNGGEMKIDIYLSRYDYITIGKTGDDCFYNIAVTVRPYTVVDSHVGNGIFRYHFPIGNGSALVNIYNNTGGIQTLFTFDYNLSMLEKIKVDNRRFSRNEKGKSLKLNFVSQHSNSADSFDIRINNIPQNASYRLSGNTEIKIGEKNIYTIYSAQTAKIPVRHMIKTYTKIAKRLKMTIVARSQRETIVIGHCNHDVLHSDPDRKTHLVGNGGENMFVVTSSEAPIVIYDLDNENKIDTLDLRQVAIKDLRLTTKDKDIIIANITLKDALKTNWYERLHVITDKAQMKIEDLELKPLPLIFADRSKNIIVIGPDDVEIDNKIIISRPIGNYTFSRSGDDSIITNAFNCNLDNAISITLKDFYTEKKMQTLLMKFADKEIDIKNEIEQINNAASLKNQIEEYKNKKHNEMRNAISTDQLTIQQRTRRETIEQHAKSGAKRLSSWIEVLANSAIKSISAFGRFAYSKCISPSSTATNRDLPNQQANSIKPSTLLSGENLSVLAALASSISNKRNRYERLQSIVPYTLNSDSVANERLYELKRFIREKVKYHSKQDRREIYSELVGVFQEIREDFKKAIDLEGNHGLDASYRLHISQVSKLIKKHKKSDSTIDCDIDLNCLFTI